MLETGRQNPDRWRGLIPAAVLLIAAAHGLFLVLGCAGIFADHPLQPDSGSYFNLASHLATAGMFSLDGQTSCAAREPLYPLFLAAFIKVGLLAPFKLTPAQCAPVLVAQLLLYAAAIAMLFVLARRAVGTRNAAAAALFLAAYPPVAQVAQLILSEVLVLPLLAGGLFFLDRRLRYGGTASLIAAAILLGLSGLVKSVHIALLPLFALVIAWRGGRRDFAPAALFLALALALPLSWTARNWVRFGQPILSSTDGGSSFYRGNLLRFEQLPNMNDPRIPADFRRELAAVPPNKADGLLFRAGLARMAAHPWRALAHFLYKFTVLTLGQFSWTSPLFLFRLFFLAFALRGALSRMRHGDTCAALALIYALATAVLYTLIYTVPRYFVPATFLLAPFFVAGMMQGCARAAVSGLQHSRHVE